MMDDLQSKRNAFYRQVRNQSKKWIRWIGNPDVATNHFDFQIGDYQGHVNWYFRDKEIIKYDGNVCVVIKNFDNKDISQFRKHPNPNHPQWIIASASISTIDDAVKWVYKSLENNILKK